MPLFHTRENLTLAIVEMSKFARLPIISRRRILSQNILLSAVLPVSNSSGETHQSMNTKTQTLVSVGLPTPATLLHRVVLCCRGAQPAECIRSTHRARCKP